MDWTMTYGLDWTKILRTELFLLPNDGHRVIMITTTTDGLGLYQPEFL